MFFLVQIKVEDSWYKSRAVNQLTNHNKINT